MNTLIVGRDLVAVDHFVARLMGFNPGKIRFIVEAEKRGLGSSKYKTVGINPDEVKVKFTIERPRWNNLYGILQNY